MSTPKTEKQKGVFSKILIAIDGSKQSINAAYYAIDVSDKFNAELYAIHVVKDPAYMEMSSFGIYDVETPFHIAELWASSHLLDVVELPLKKLLSSFTTTSGCSSAI
jgi:nucleotide-binding universal stress UspA family protein